MRRVIKEHKAFKVRRERKAIKAERGCKVRRGCRGIKARKGHRARRVCKVFLDWMALTERWVRKAIKGRKGSKVTKEHKARKDFKGHRGLKDSPVRRVIKGLPASMVLMVLGCRDRRVHRDRPASALAFLG